MDHGEVFRNLLEYKKISIPELSEKTKIPKTTLYTLSGRKTKKTSKDVLAKISKALDVPIDIWDSPEELYLLCSMNIKSNSVILNKEFINTSGKSAPYIKYCLDAIGYNNAYSINDINNIIINSIPVSKELADDIYNIIIANPLIKREELQLIRQFSNLSKEQRKTIIYLIEEFLKAKKYDLEEETKMLNISNNQS